MSFRASAPSAQPSRRPSMTRSCRFLRSRRSGAALPACARQSSLAVWSSGERHAARRRRSCAAAFMFRPSAPRSPSARPRPRWSWIRRSARTIFRSMSASRSARRAATTVRSFPRRPRSRARLSSLISKRCAVRYARRRRSSGRPESACRASTSAAVRRRRCPRSSSNG